MSWKTCIFLKRVTTTSNCICEVCHDLHWPKAPWHFATWQSNKTHTYGLSVDVFKYPYFQRSIYLIKSYLINWSLCLKIVGHTEILSWMTQPKSKYFWVLIKQMSTPYDHFTSKVDLKLWRGQLIIWTPKYDIKSLTHSKHWMDI